MPNRLIAGLLLYLLMQPAYTLDSDAEQPAILDADNIEMDFNTGTRIYRGDVVFTKGSIRMDCDELVTYQDDNETLGKVICTGEPARFKQRPQDQDEDMHASALEITLHQAEDQMILESRARLEQGATTITGETITYNLATRKAIIEGGAKQGTQSGSSGESEDTSRVRLVTQPKEGESE